jgi:hypothetical protein
MAKNLFKKGLSLAAASALGAAMLVGVASPAHAAGELKIEPSAGSLYAVGSSDAFTLKTSFNTGYSSSGVTSLLKYKLTQGGAGGFLVNAKAGATANAVNIATEIDGTGVAASDTDKTAVFDAQDAAVGYLGLAIGSAATNTTYSVGVQAWVDTDGDNVVDSDEWSSNAVTVSFIKYSDWALSLDIVDPVRAATTVTVHATSSNINLQQVGPDDLATGVVEVNIAVNGSSAIDDVLIWDAADSRLEGTTGTITALAAGDIVKASAKVTAEANTAADISTFSYGTAVKTRSESVVAASVTAIASGVTEISGSASGAIPTGSGTVVVRTAVTHATGVTSGATVLYTLSEQAVNSIETDSTVAAGGKTLTNTNAGTVQSTLATIQSTSDADGYAYLTITYTNLDAGNKFNVDATIEGYSATQLTLTATAPVASALSNINAIGTDTNSAELHFVEDAAFDLKYAVLDQYGALLTVAGHTVTVSDGTNSWSGAVVNGYATVTVAAYATGTSKTMTPTVYKNGVDVSIDEPTAEVTIYNVGSAPAAATSITALGSVSSGNTGIVDTSKRVLNLNASVNADTRIGGSAPTTPTSASGITVSGTARDANLDETTVLVTLSAPGLMFEADGVWSIGSITVHADVDGKYTADVYSNLAGAHTVTVTAGSASKTEVLYYADADDNAGTQLVITAPDNVLPGSTLSVTAKVTDKFGNPINTVSTTDTSNDAASELLGDFGMTYTGPGLIVGSVPTETDLTGSAKLGYLIGSNDSGTITVTAKYDANGDADYTDAGDLVVTKTITIGAAAVAQKVNAGSFKGYVAVYARGYEGQRLSAKIGKDWVVVPSIVNNQENGTLFRVTDFTGAGVDIAVRIYIDRVLIDTINLTTK